MDLEQLIDFSLTEIAENEVLCSKYPYVCEKARMSSYRSRLIHACLDIIDDGVADIWEALGQLNQELSDD